MRFPLRGISCLCECSDASGVFDQNINYGGKGKFSTPTHLSEFALVTLTKSLAEIPIAKY